MKAAEIVHLSADECRRLREIRLRALADCPDAFGSTLERELAFGDDEWRERLRRAGVVTFVAAGKAGDIGLATGAPYDDEAGLYSMWVAPEARGQGIGGRLVDAVIGWARAEGHSRLVLDVGDWNTVAIALYQGKGFEPTGVRGVLPAPREHITEHQRALQLGECR